MHMSRRRPMSRDAACRRNDDADNDSPRC
jgi:hypothetical protein